MKVPARFRVIETRVPRIGNWSSMHGVEDAGFGVWGLGFGIWGLGFGVSGFGFRVSGFGFSFFRVEG